MSPFKNWITILLEIERASGFLDAAQLKGDWINDMQSAALILEAHHNLHANCMQIARNNYNLPLIVRGYRETEPQINADERGFVDLNLQLLPTVYSTTKSPQSAQRTQSAELFATFELRSGKRPKTRRRTRMTRIQRIFTDLHVSASSAQSAFHHVCSSLKKPASGVSALICVNLRFFKNVIFQTGLTGSTGYVFNPVHPVIKERRITTKELESHY